jgi:hypothetical protein
MRRVEEFRLDPAGALQKITASWESYHFTHVSACWNGGVLSLSVSAVVDSELKPFERAFLVKGKGEELPKATSFVGAVLVSGVPGYRILHVFEVRPYADRPKRPETPRAKDGNLL